MTGVELDQKSADLQVKQSPPLLLCLMKTTQISLSERSIIGNRDLATIRPACFLDRQFPENLLFGQAKISIKNFQFWLFGGNNKIFS